VGYDLVPWECCLNKGSVVCSKGLEGRVYCTGTGRLHKCSS
jgi:hypothetical protein